MLPMCVGPRAALPSSMWLASSAPTSSLPDLEAATWVPFGRAPLMPAFEAKIFLTSYLTLAGEEEQWPLSLQHPTHP